MAKGPTTWQRTRGRPKVWIYRRLTRWLCTIDGHRVVKVKWIGGGVTYSCQRPFCDFTLPSDTAPNAEGDPVPIPLARHG